ncbi:hypothetical protein HY449_01545 [Candidatus Pacearchaeota archaeon]|nr:hypothetical protein [Candidatus Pacearchaeota archaeon]
MENKSGQITIFIIFLLVLVFGTVIYFFINSGVQNKNAVQKTTDPIYIYTQECVENALFDSAKFFGLQQGYYIVPKTSLETSLYRIAYYYLRGESLIPENQFFEEEFSKIANDQILKQCADFSIFKEQGYAIKPGSPTIKTKIYSDNLKINVNYPISVSANKSSYEVSAFDYEIPLRIGHILDVGRALVDEIKKEPYALDMTFLLNQDVDVSVQKYDRCNQIYLILDDQSKTNDGESYFYSFAVGFSEEYCINEDNIL